MEDGWKVRMNICTALWSFVNFCCLSQSEVSTDNRKVSTFFAFQHVRCRCCYRSYLDRFLIVQRQRWPASEANHERTRPSQSLLLSCATLAWLPSTPSNEELTGRLRQKKKHACIPMCLNISDVKVFVFTIIISPSKSLLEIMSNLEQCIRLMKVSQKHFAADRIIKSLVGFWLPMLQRSVLEITSLRRGGMEPMEHFF